MRKFIRVALCLSVIAAATLVVAGSVRAADEKRASPHEQVSVTVPFASWLTGLVVYSTPTPVTDTLQS